MMNLLFNPNGRIDQPTYWRAVLILFAASTAVTVLSTYVSGIVGLLSLVVMWCWIAIHAKRFHDNGKTGWLQLFVILFAWLVLYVLQLFLAPLVGGDIEAASSAMSDALSGSSPDFQAFFSAAREAAKASMVPEIISTLIATGLIGLVMSLFKTDPEDNVHGPGPAGSGVDFTPSAN